VQASFFYFPQSVALHINMLRKRRVIVMNMSNISSTERAFSLIELMIVVSLIGIIATIAVPSYVQYTNRANRLVTEAFMLNVANKEEQFMLDTRQYVIVTVPVNDPAKCKLGTLTLGTLLTIPYEVCNNYNMSVTADGNYTIIATPIDNQLANDKNCGKLTLNQAGTKSIYGTGTIAITGTTQAINCWSGK